MALFTASAVHLRRIRFTRLDALGVPVSGATNAYVIDDGVSLQLTPEIEAGDEQNLKTGAGVLCATVKNPDIFKRWTFAFTGCKMSPALNDIVLGDGIVTGTNATGLAPAAGTDQIGSVFPDQLGCGTPYNPNGVAIDAWADSWACDAQGSSPRRYIQFHFPKAICQMGELTLENDIAKVIINGFSRTNNAYGNPFTDLPPSVVGSNPQGCWFFTDLIPPAAAAYVAVP